MKKEIEVVVHDVGIHGEGIGSLEGLTIFVDGALPGERVLAEIEVKKRNYAKARLIKILDASPARIEPICPLFGRCGGCQIMHLAYLQQLQLKRKKVVDALERIGKLKDFEVAECEPSPHPLHYRNKLQLPVARGIEGDLKIGLYARGSHEVIAVDRCFIHNSLGEELLQDLKRLILKSEITPFDEKSGQGELRHLLIKSSMAKSQLLVTLITARPVTETLRKLAGEIQKLPHVAGVVHALNNREGNAVYGDVYTLLTGEGTIEEEILGLRVRISPASFFQVNIWQAEKLYLKAAELANLTPGMKVVDAYSGIGTFALFLASKGADVIGIECVSAATEDARANGLRNQIKAQFMTAKVEEAIASLPHIDTIFVNPPRKGCDPRVLEEIAHRGIKKVVYTSCDPATLARDLHYLQAQGYSNTCAFPFDMFPQTMHVETVAVMELVGRA